MKEKHKWKKLLVLLLALAMVLCCVPADNLVIAVEEEGASSEQIATQQTEVYEVVGLREENVKHFALGDGTFQAVAFGGPVHTLDADGHWQDIDNTLLLTVADGDEAYSNQRVSFAPSLSADETVLTVNENGYTISMGVLSGGEQISPISETEPVSAVVSNSSMARTVQTAATVEELIQMRSTSTVLYENILPNTDLEYILTYKDVKENIIVKAPSDSYCYSFALNLEGLDAQLQEDGSVTITDSISGEEQYIIPAPYMYDANGQYSDAVTYDLIHTNDRYYLSVTADAQWINAEERYFPVTIDPSINTTSTVYDSYISSAKPSTTFGSSTAMWVSDGDSTSRHGESMVFVMIPNLPDLPTNATVTNTYLHMYYGYYTQDTTTGYVQVGAYRITEPWTESGVNWISRQIYDNYGISTTRLGSANAVAGTANQYTPGELSISLGNLGQTWYDGYYNYGVALRYIGGPNMSVMFRSSETNYKPYIVFHYNASPDAEFVYIPDTSEGHDHLPAITHAISLLSDLGYSTYRVSNQATAPSFRDKLASSKLFLCRAHGEPQCVFLSEGANFSITDLSGYSSSYLSGSDLIIYGSCLTGSGYENGDNLVNATHAHGAKTVIGFATIVQCLELNDWLDVFFEELANGASIHQACVNADSAILAKYDHITTNSWHIAGDADAVFNG